MRTVHEMPPGCSPALRLLAEDGRVRTRKPIVIAVAIAARLGLARAHTLWPNAAAPAIAVDPHTAAAEWLRRTFETDPAAPRDSGARGTLKRRLGPRTWNALRAGAVLTGRAPRWLIEACQRALGGELEDPSLALYSPSGSPLSKVLCFVFATGASEPSAVVIAMADPKQSARLRREFEAVEAVRDMLPAESLLRAALPLEPLAEEERDGDLVMIVPPDPLAASTGSVDRVRALAWLATFQAETATGALSWNHDADRGELIAVEQAWGALRPGALDSVSAAVAARFAGLGGRSVPRVASHGDFWSGNIAGDAGRLRVYDWEWAEAGQPPFHDVWTYELAELAAGRDRSRAAVEVALGRVRERLGAAGLDPGFAAPTLCSTAARLAVRIRLATGVAGPAEVAMGELMDAAEGIVRS